MRRRVNSTGRKRIERQHVRITLGSDALGRPLVTAKFRLDDLKLPGDGRIFLEAYRHGFVERLPYGTVKSPSAEGASVLEELGPEGVLFRVKIVDPGSGKMLALGRRLGAGDDTQPRQELFRVKLGDLRQEVWCVRLNDLAAPTLLLNNRIPDIASRFRRSDFRAHVLPAAMRMVLLELWRTDQEPDEDEPADASWARRWWDFAEALAGEESPDVNDPTRMLDWIDRACAAFAARHGLTDKLLDSERRGVEA